MQCPTHLLANTCNVERPTETVDAGGAPKSAFTTNLTSIRCLVQPADGKEILKYGRLDTEITHSVYVEPGQDIVAKDRVIVSGRSPLNVRFVCDFDLAGVLTRLDCTEDTGWSG